MNISMQSMGRLYVVHIWTIKFLFFPNNIISVKQGCSLKPTLHDLDIADFKHKVAKLVMEEDIKGVIDDVVLLPIL